SLIAMVLMLRLVNRSYLRHSLTARSRFAPNGTMTKPAPRVIVERPSALASLQAKMAITQAPADATRSPNVHCPSSPCLTNEAYSRRLSPTPPRSRRRRGISSTSLRPCPHYRHYPQQG